MMNPFDIQEWKPTFCKTEKELNAFWEENQIARKKNHQNQCHRYSAQLRGLGFKRTHTEDVKRRRSYCTSYAENEQGIV